MPGSDNPIVVISYLDAGYLSRAIAMFESLNSDPGVSFVFLAWDVETQSALSTLKNATVVHIDCFLLGHPELHAAIEDRNKAESFFTVGPSFIKWVAENRQSADWIVYVDADVFFYQALSDYLEKFKLATAILVPHRHYPWNRKRLAKYGTYNVGVVAFRNTPSGKSIMSYWAQACVEWCFDVPSSSRYADQKYLENFANFAEDVLIDESVGANLAPWNIGLIRLTHSGSGNLLARGESVIYFHFQGLVRSGVVWRLGHARYLSLATRSQKNLLYKPYINKIERISEQMGVSRAGSARKSQTLVGVIFSMASWVFDLVTLQFVIVRRSRVEKNTDE